MKNNNICYKKIIANYNTEFCTGNMEKQKIKTIIPGPFVNPLLVKTVVNLNQKQCDRGSLCNSNQYGQRQFLIDTNSCCFVPKRGIPDSFMDYITYRSFKDDIKMKPFLDKYLSHQKESINIVKTLYKTNRIAPLQGIPDPYRMPPIMEYNDKNVLTVSPSNISEISNNPIKIKDNGYSTTRKDKNKKQNKSQTNETENSINYVSDQDSVIEKEILTCPLADSKAPINISTIDNLGLLRNTSILRKTDKYNCSSVIVNYKPPKPKKQPPIKKPPPPRVNANNKCVLSCTKPNPRCDNRCPNKINDFRRHECNCSNINDKRQYSKCCQENTFNRPCYSNPLNCKSYYNNQNSCNQTNRCNNNPCWDNRRSKNMEKCYTCDTKDELFIISGNNLNNRINNCENISNLIEMGFKFNNNNNSNKCIDTTLDNDANKDIVIKNDKCYYYQPNRSDNRRIEEDMNPRNENMCEMMQRNQHRNEFLNDFENETTQRNQQIYCNNKPIDQNQKDIDNQNSINNKKGKHKRKNNSDNCVSRNRIESGCPHTIMQCKETDCKTMNSLEKQRVTRRNNVFDNEFKYCETSEICQQNKDKRTNYKIYQDTIQNRETKCKGKCNLDNAKLIKNKKLIQPEIVNSANNDNVDNTFINKNIYKTEEQYKNNKNLDNEELNKNESDFDYGSCESSVMSIQTNDIRPGEKTNPNKIYKNEIQLQINSDSDTTDLNRNENELRKADLSPEKPLNQKKIYKNEIQLQINSDSDTTDLNQNENELQKADLSPEKPLNQKKIYKNEIQLQINSDSDTTDLNRNENEVRKADLSPEKPLNQKKIYKNEIQLQINSDSDTTDLNRNENEVRKADLSPEKPLNQKKTYKNEIQLQINSDSDITDLNQNENELRKADLSPEKPLNQKKIYKNEIQLQINSDSDITDLNQNEQRKADLSPEKPLNQKKIYKNEIQLQINSDSDITDLNQKENELRKADLSPEKPLNQKKIYKNEIQHQINNDLDNEGLTNNENQNQNLAYGPIIDNKHKKHRRSKNLDNEFENHEFKGGQNSNVNKVNKHKKNNIVDDGRAARKDKPKKQKKSLLNEDYINEYEIKSEKYNPMENKSSIERPDPGVRSILHNPNKQNTTNTNTTNDLNEISKYKNKCNNVNTMDKSTSIKENSETSLLTSEKMVNIQRFSPSITSTNGNRNCLCDQKDKCSVLCSQSEGTKKCRHVLPLDDCKKKKSVSF